MKTQAGFLLLAAGLNAVLAEDKYFEIGGELSLKPVPLSERITTITWKLNGYIVAEWIEGADAGPVQYFWKQGEGEWKESQEDLNITNNEETQQIKTFSCNMKNPISEKESGPLDNPFIMMPKSVLGIVLRSLALLTFCCCSWFLWQKRKTLCQCKTTENEVNDI
ncbi:uncharacterized protein LOC108246624 [Kryptolebias marmoratus]|uniref:uncharacterized protein LOC108246624 n=1 Tax=Kryptolebias marmoratus TaxID=37003 RepID=UPI0018AC95CB|nr:uncharacterized protein LOC108246624 [Kryptolebias marmoratus]